MRYSEDLIEEVRQRSDIVDVISSYVTLKKKGSSHFGLCPFHNEKSPSFSVSRDKQMFYCFGCGKGGNVFTFLMEYNRLTFYEAMEELAGKAGIELPDREQTPGERRQADAKSALREMNRQAGIYFHYMLTKTPRGKLALEYLTNRGISDETIRNFGLGYADISRDGLYRYLKNKGFKDEQLKDSSLVTIDPVKGTRDNFFNRVMFPIMDVNQKVVGFGGRVMGDGQPKYLNSRETVLFDKSRNLYGLNYAKRSRKQGIILCEGYMDVISLHQAGFDNAVAPLGTAFTPGQANLLKRYTDDVILSFDSDGAGVKAALRALPIIRESGLRGRVVSMKPYKDPDELIKAEGPEAYQKKLDEAMPGRMFEISVMEKRYNQNDPDSRTQFVHEAAKNLAQITDAVERNNYADAVSNRFMINRKALEELIVKYGMRQEYVKVQEQYKREPETTVQKEEKKQKKKNQPQRLLLTKLVEEPEFYTLIKTYINVNDFLTPLYKSVAIMLFEQLESGDKLNPAKIINQFIDVEEQQEVASIFHTHLDYELEDTDVYKALTDVVKKVKLASIADKMEHCADIVEYQRLIKEKNKFSKLKIQPINF